MKICDREKSIAIVKEVLTDYHKLLKTYSDLNSRLIIDSTNQKYILILFGSYKNQSIYTDLVNLTIHGSEIVCLVDRINIIRDIKIRYPYCDPQYYGNEENYYIYSPQLKIDDFDLVFNLDKMYKLNEELFIDGFNDENFKIKSDVTPEKLTELAKINHPKILQSIAIYPNTPASILLELFPDFTTEVLQNPSLKLLADRDKTFLEQLYNTYSYLFYEEELLFPRFFIEWAVNCKIDNVRLALVCNYKIPLSVDDLTKLVNYSSYKITFHIIRRLESMNKEEKDKDILLLQRQLEQHLKLKYSDRIPEEDDIPF